MKIEFKNLTIECDEEFESRIRRMLNADRLYSALNEVRQDVFRPARKHGYPDQRIQRLLDQANTLTDADGYGVGSELVSQLERMFYDLLAESGVDLDECY